MNLIERRSYWTGYPLVYGYDSHFFSTFGDLDANHLPVATRKTNTLGYDLLFSPCTSTMSTRHLSMLTPGHTHCTTLTACSTR